MANWLKHTKRLRHSIADLVIWQWGKMSHLSAWIYSWLWRGGNGEAGYPDELESEDTQ